MASDHNSIAAEADGLRLEGMSYPINVRAGKGMALTGTANAALGTTLTNVQVAVLDENDQTVFTAQAAPNTAIFSFKSLDSSIRFGELPAGNYTYMVIVTDSQGDNLCFTSDFTVSDGSASSGVYWSVKDTEGTKLLDTFRKFRMPLQMQLSPLWAGLAVYSSKIINEKKEVPEYTSGISFLL